MYFAPKEYHLFNNLNVVMRSPVCSDAAAFVRYTRALASQGHLNWRSITVTEAECAKMFLRAPKDPHQCLLLLLLDGEVVAHMSGGIQPQSPVPSLFGFTIDVHGQYKEYDIYLAMFAAAEHVARTLGATQMMVSFPSYDTLSRTFYEDNGFVEQPDPFFDPNGYLEYFVHMLKQL